MTGLQSGNGDGQYGSVVNFNTAYGFVLIRYLLRDNTTDTSNVRQLQQQTKLYPLSRRKSSIARSSIPDLFSAAAFPDPETNNPEKLMTLLAAIHPFSAAPYAPDIPRVNKLLSLAGVSNGTYHTPSGVDLLSTYYLAGNSTVTAYSTALTSLGDGWSLPPYNATGSYGTAYSIRAVISVIAYAQPVPQLAISPSYMGPSRSVVSQFSLGPRQAVLLTFHGKPPVSRAGGFWSLTAYQANEYLIWKLIDNPQRVYALGDRSSIKFADGSPVYRQKQQQHDDRSRDLFQILVQPADVLPPKNWTENWLPGPSGGGDIFLDCGFFFRIFLIDHVFQFPRRRKGTSGSRFN